MIQTRTNRILSCVLTALLLFGLVACNRPKRRSASNSDSDLASVGRLSELGARAGDANESGLQELYKLQSSALPAPVRPDPDLYARRFLARFHEPSPVSSRILAGFETYRNLLGGASEDFRVVPQETYDSTSLLSQAQIAEKICTQLITPDRGTGWGVAVSVDIQDVEGSLKNLAAAILGLPVSAVSSETIASLKSLVGTPKSLADYIPACTALSIDAEALYL